ncbi:universal stress protein [Baaleninema simplex]|uniref:universal stress protein n=1 Tax=Baaleninema simplex TaxID=2862350 RepID=UPI000347DEDF|nr:universal stress protein [Baaleninema simplex]
MFDRALSIAEPHTAEVKFVHFLNEPVITPTPTPLGTGIGAGWYSPVSTELPQMERPEYQDQLEEVRSWLKRYEEEARLRGVRAHCESNIGEPGFWICELAKEWNADLIVVGRRGRKGLAEVVLGSVSNYVLHNAPCSVLTVQSETVDTEEES